MWNEMFMWSSRNLRLIRELKIKEAKKWSLQRVAFLSMGIFSQLQLHTKHTIVVSFKAPFIDI